MKPLSIFYFLKRGVLFFTFSLSAILLAGCDAKPSSPFIGHDISGSGLGQNLNMQDSNGTLRTLNDFKGKVLVVFFGYTQCPDVCPTALSQLAQAMQILGDQASEVQVIMITVDPERDTPALLNEYVQLFHPDFIGLSGTAAQLHKTAQSFKAFYIKAPSLQAGQYGMDHSSAFYLLDQTGAIRSLLPGEATPEDLAHDLSVLIQSP